METQEKIKRAQTELQIHDIDGWLLYDFQGTNSLSLHFLMISPTLHTTRRLFYFIPQKGNPLKIVHQIESHLLDHLPGEKKIYSNWRELHAHLKAAVSGKSRIAMEYSPNQAIPAVSKVDGGLIELLRSFGVVIVSSALFLQIFTCVWNKQQYDSHKEGAIFLDATVFLAWDFIREGIKNRKKLTEYDVQQLILNEFKKNNYITEGEPICGVNAHSADPHYAPRESNSYEIKKGDFVLIDLWAKKNISSGVFADITRVAVVDEYPSEKQQMIFSFVRKAQKAATEFIQERYKNKQEVKGCEVDKICRDVIEKAGYGKFFPHRTGHNINTEVHGPGANIDSLETEDDRPLIPGTCFSIEPGIYLPGEFGVRLEYDLFIHPTGEVEITAPPQEKIQCLLYEKEFL